MTSMILLLPPTASLGNIIKNLKENNGELKACLIDYKNETVRDFRDNQEKFIKNYLTISRDYEMGRVDDEIHKTLVGQLNTVGSDYSHTVIEFTFPTNLDKHLNNYQNLPNPDTVARSIIGSEGPHGVINITPYQDETIVDQDFRVPLYNTYQVELETIFPEERLDQDRCLIDDVYFLAQEYRGDFDFSVNYGQPSDEEIIDDLTHPYDQIANRLIHHFQKPLFDILETRFYGEPTPPLFNEETITSLMREVYN